MTKRVLLCDDEIHILRAVEFKVSRAGYSVRCADDGQEAWELIQEECPDMLVTDCQMPRMDGFQLVEKIRDNEKTAHLPVVMLTAKGFEFTPSDVAEKWGVIAILSKPFSPRELLRCIDQVLESGTYTPPMPAL